MYYHKRCVPSIRHSSFVTFVYIDTCIMMRKEFHSISMHYVFSYDMRQYKIENNIIIRMQLSTFNLLAVLQNKFKLCYILNFYILTIARLQNTHSNKSFVSLDRRVEFVQVQQMTTQNWRFCYYLACIKQS